MQKLSHVTFTGVDDRTDVERLKDIARRYPFAEFGILFSESADNRYPDVIPLLKALDKSGVRLSAHLCGKMARKIVETGDFTEFRKACGIRADLFARCQLNVAGHSVDNPTRFLWFPATMKEVIVQKKTGDGILYRHFSQYNPCCAPLLDDSGGRGRRGKLSYVDAEHAGYAGGIGPDNVADVLAEICAWEGVHGYWIDMESNVRTRDWFDLDKVEAVCEKVDGFLKARS